MIPKTCETCELHSCYQRHANKPCHDWAPDLGQWDTKIAELEASIVNTRDECRNAMKKSNDLIFRLEAEVARLTKERDKNRDENRAHAKALADAVTFWQGITLTTCNERRAAIAQVSARDEEIATLSAQAEDWAAQYRALSASVESERAGLRHSLSEVEDERDEAVSAMAEWRARAEVAEPERDRLREELGAMLAVIDGNRSCHYGLEANSKFRESVARLRALLGEAKGGGGA